MNATYFNAFLAATANLLEGHLGLSVRHGKPCLEKDAPEVQDPIALQVGILVDQSYGLFTLELSNATALQLAEHMLLGLKVRGWDELEKSAVKEMTNILAAGAVTRFPGQGAGADITPPMFIPSPDMDTVAAERPAVAVPLQWKGGHANLYLISPAFTWADTADIKRPPKKKTGGGELFIALVDDDPRDRHMTVGLLNKTGRPVRIEEFDSGQMLLDRLDEWAEAGSPLPGIIVLDLNMPGLNGIDTLVRVKADERFKGCRVVMLTSSRVAQHISECYQLGATAFLSKPGQTVQLDKVREALQKAVE